MNQRTFESRLLQLWMTTRVPLTRANLLYYTQADRKQVQRWLEELVADGVLELDADADGEMIWTVRGARRPESGPERIDQVDAAAPAPPSLSLDDKLAQLRNKALVHVAKSGGGLALASQAAGLMQPTKAGDKSLLLSGILSTFFGPLGWLYAAPFKVAVPASVIMLVLGYLLGWHVIGFSLIFGAVGVAYAWRHNQSGRRSPLFGTSEPQPEPPLLPRKR